MNVIPSLIEGASTLYDLYRGNTKSGNNNLGLKKSDVRKIGHYNKNGKKLAIYHR